MFPQSTENRHRADLDRRWSRVLLVVGVAFLVGSRFILFIRYGEAPLGYDTGFYLSSIEGTLRDLIAGASTIHRAFRAFLWVPLTWLNIPPVLIFHGLYVLTQILVAGAFYFLVRSFTVSRHVAHGAITVFLFAVSVPQFFAYWWAFYQMEIAIALLLLTWAFIRRRSLLAIATAALGSALHPASFLPFLVALCVAVVLELCIAAVRREWPEREIRFLIAVGAVGAIIVARFYDSINEFALVYLQGSVRQHGWLITQYPEHLREQFTGLFIPFSIFRDAEVSLLPFSVVGLLALVFQFVRYGARSTYVQQRFLVLFGTVLFTLAYFPFIYQNRFLILLDLVLILLAVAPLMAFVDAFRRDRLGRAAIVLLFGGFLLQATLTVWRQEPQVYPDELHELKMIANTVEPNAYAMATESVYTPWVITFANRETIDPGYLQTNQWDLKMWQEFWSGKSDARRYELLKMYHRPMYIFIGRRVPTGIRYVRFIRSESYFVQISPHVWRLDPTEVPEGYVAEMRRRETAGTL